MCAILSHDEQYDIQAKKHVLLLLLQCCNTLDKNEEKC